MGIVATYSREKVASGKTNPTPKNRVWGNFKNPNGTRLENRRQPFKTRLENTPRTKKTASGVLYYGYRYYDPVTGRWPSRDPLGENWSSGEFNEYSFVNNDGVNSGDYLGLSEMTWGQYVALPIAANAARGGSRGGPWLAAAGAVIGAGVAADAILDSVRESSDSLREAERALAETTRRIAALAALKATCDVLAQAVRDAKDDPNIIRCKDCDSDATLALKIAAWEVLAAARAAQNQACSSFLSSQRSIDEHIKKQKEAYDNYTRCLEKLAAR